MLSDDTFVILALDFFALDYFFALATPSSKSFSLTQLRTH